jgi:hypothetical protein
MITATVPLAAGSAVPKAQFDFKPVALLAAVLLLAWPLIRSSSTWVTLSVAGSAPPRIMPGTRDQAGKGSSAPMNAAAMAPARSWPSPPMFQKRARKAIATARPVSTSGAAFTQVSIALKRLPKAPLKRAP